CKQEDRSDLGPGMLDLGPGSWLCSLGLRRDEIQGDCQGRVANRGGEVGASLADLVKGVEVAVVRLQNPVTHVEDAKGVQPWLAAGEESFKFCAGTLEVGQNLVVKVV